MPSLTVGRITGLPIILTVAWGVIGLGGGGALAAEQANPYRGRALYMEYCLQCHGDHGKGWGWSNKVPPPPVPIPDLSDVKRMEQLSDQYLFDIIKGGGEAVGKTRLMPPAGRVMSDEAIWDVIAYLRSLATQAQGRSGQAR